MPPQDVPERISLSSGLEGYDDDLEVLMRFFDQLQLLSPDVADPQLDLLTFAHSAYYFGVISELPEKREVEEPEEPLGIIGPDGEIIPDRNAESSNRGGSLPSPEPQGEHEEDMDSEEQYIHRAPSEVMYEASGISSSVLLGDVKYGIVDGLSDLWSPNTTLNRRAFGTLPEVPLAPPLPKSPKLVGIVYLAASQQTTDYLRSGELNMGIYLDQPYRNKGYARQAVNVALGMAFSDHNCQRVQAILVDNWAKDRALSLFMKSGLGHEGTRRRAFRSPYDNEWKDVTYLGILATDWLVHNRNNTKFKVAPKSLWDELFARHQREREELLRWEEKNLKRSNSMETIRELQPVIPLADSDTGSVYSDSSSHSPKRRRVRSPSVSSQSGTSGDEYDASASENESDDGRGNGLSDWSRVNAFQESISLTAARDQSPAFTDSSGLTSDVSDGYTSCSSHSQWDILETESNSGLSDFNYQMLNINDEL